MLQKLRGWLCCAATSLELLELVASKQRDRVERLVLDRPPAAFAWLILVEAVAIDDVLSAAQVTRVAQ